MAKAEKLTASAYGAMVELGSDQINISDKTSKVILLNGQQIWPVLAAMTAVQAVAATAPMDMGQLAVLQEIVKKLGLKPGDANPSADLLPAETGLGGLALAGLMADNGDALITTPDYLPQRVSWNTLADRATEADIKNQSINVHHLFRVQGAKDYGFEDWRAANMKFEDKHVGDESWMLWKFSEAGGKKMFDKSGSFPASAFWSARRFDSYYACFQWVGDGFQYDHTSLRPRELPVRPVRRVPLSPGPT